LKWENQVKSAAIKANYKLGQLTKAFKYKDKEIVKSLYCTFVRPFLEFAIPVWCPYYEKDIEILERIQHKATKLAPEIRHLNYEERLKALELTSLRHRRIRGDLIQQYKIHHGIDKVIWHSPPQFITSSNHTRGHMARIQKQKITNCAHRENFFTNRVVNYWNNLTDDIVNAVTVNSFKSKIDKILPDLIIKAHKLTN